MEVTSQIIGSEGSILCYNLNKQFSTVKKVIITKEILMASFDADKLRTLIGELKSSDFNTYEKIFNDSPHVFEGNLKSDLYTQIQDALNRVSNNYMDVKLKDYNFMHSVSNAKFNITLRCESFSITQYYIEKGSLTTNIKSLIKDYLRFKGNLLRLNMLENFQIEIYESEEIYKKIYLKKEGNAIVLSAFFGFPKNSPFDYATGCEFYVSKGNEFQFFKNNQTTAVLREHGKLVEKEINVQQNVLSNEDLVLINEKTKNIEDALIDCYITDKGQFKILSLSLIDSPIGDYSENGFIINKSLNNYDRIAIVNMRDNFEEDFVNPRYLLLKGEGSIKEFLADIQIVNNIDGIIITKNFYSLFLETIGQEKNIDILYFNGQLQKALDEKINWVKFNIESSQNNKEASPFSQIISTQNKEKDEMLERLKNVDLNTPKRDSIRNDVNQKTIEQMALGIIGSEESSFNKPQNTSLMNSTPPSSNGEKKSAIGMLMASALTQKDKMQVPKSNQSIPPQIKQNTLDQQLPQEVQKDLNKYAMQDSLVHREEMDSFDNNQKYSQDAKDDFSQAKDKAINDAINFESLNINDNQFVTNDSFLNNQQGYRTEQNINNKMSNVDITRYDGVLATQIITTPNLKGDSFFVDMNTISQLRGGKAYYLTLNPSEMKNPNLNYVLPIGLNSKDITNCSLLINSTQDYFLIDKNQKNVKYFVNITQMNESLKKNFIYDITNKIGSIFLVCNKADIDLIEDKINMIEGLQVQNIETNTELEEIKIKILSFEKKFLMRQ